MPMSNRFQNRLMAGVFLLVFAFSSSLGAQSVATEPAAAGTAQTSQVTSPDVKPLPLLTKDDFFSKGFVHQLVRDQKSIWTSPAHLKASDAKWIAPLAAGTA